jgi:hypothetical protein
MTKVVHCKKEKYDILIDRSSPYGNPFTHQEGTKALIIVPTREESIALCKRWIHREIKLRGVEPPSIEQILELKDKALGCWCSPQSCHGSIFVEICDSSDVPSF